MILGLYLLIGLAAFLLSLPRFYPDYRAARKLPASPYGEAVGLLLLPPLLFGLFWPLHLLLFLIRPLRDWVERHELVP